MNLDVAQRLEAVLTAYGYRVVMTRDSDVFVPLGTRVAIANSYRDAIFVCIHFNAASRRSASGIETYFYSRKVCRSLPRFIIMWPAAHHGESRGQTPRLLRLTKNDDPVGAGGMRVPDQRGRSELRTERRLSTRNSRKNWARRS